MDEAALLLPGHDAGPFEAGQDLVVRRRLEAALLQGEQRGQLVLRRHGDVGRVLAPGDPVGEPVDAADLGPLHLHRGTRPAGPGRHGADDEADDQQEQGRLDVVTREMESDR